MAFKDRASPGFFNKKDIIIRHVIILLLAVFFSTIGKFEQSVPEVCAHILDKFLYIALIWNGNILLIDLIDRDLSWEKHLHLKLILSGSVAVVLPVSMHFFYKLVIHQIILGKQHALFSKESITYLIISVSIALLVNTIFVALAFFKFWKTTIKEKEELKRESISAEFETLRNQVNPHFLFNSLNTLTSLIEEDPKTATDFVQKLSGVYRYVLTQKDKDTVTLGEELQFIMQYIYLNKIRFGENLRIHVHIEPKYTERKIVTLALQMLLENAIKHNVVSSQKPLSIFIGVYDDKVFVRNNLQRKIVMNESNGIGLNNIVHRYSFLTKEQVEIVEDDKEFCVSIPLI
jgi:two-component system LytT family sensor kinase